MGTLLRWFLPAIVPAIIALFLVHRSDKRREPIGIVIVTFLLGVVFAAGAFYIEGKAARWTGLDVRTHVAGQAGALLFLFALVAPMREAAKVAAAWPAFLSRHFDEPADGVVYSSAAALGFAAFENAVMLRANPEGALWILRAFLAMPAHLFFAALWGYGLGRAKRSKRPGAIFPTLWLVATFSHALYIHFVYGRGPGAILGVVPMLALMGILVWFIARDLRSRGDELPPSSLLYSGPRSLEAFADSVSFKAMQAALRKSNRGLGFRWVIFGAFVTLGAMVVGLVGAVALGHYAHVDFSQVDEGDVTTTAPVALLGAGLLAAFPASGFLTARASGLSGLLEPALAAALAIVIVLLALGLAAPIAIVFALAFSPIAFGLACAGAIVGRPDR